MAQFIKIARRKWRVRYSVGFLPNGKRRVLDRVINGTKKDAREWVAAIHKEREERGVIEGQLVVPSGDGYSYVYAVRMCIPGYPDCPIKIGFSTSIERRRQALSGAGPFPLEWIGCWRAPDGRYDELRLHERFKKWRLVGEWFSPHADLLAEINRNIQQPKAA